MKMLFTMSWLAALCAALVLASELAHAQKVDPEELPDPIHFIPLRPKLLIGPRMGINRNYHSGGFRVLSGSDCPKFSAGTGWGYVGGITAEFAVGASWSIVPAIGYESRPGYFREELPTARALLEGSNGLPVDQTVSTSSTVTYKLIEAEVMYKQNLITIDKSLRFAVAAGPAASYIVGGTITQVQDLDAPDNARFLPVQRSDGSYIPTDPSGRRLIFSDNANIPGRNSIRFSLKAGLQAEVGLFHNKWVMYPGIFYDYGLSRVTNLENWNLNTLLFQIDLRRAF